MHSQTNLLKKWIDESEAVTVFTGAGISTESGISDYRSKGGRWSRFQPVSIQEFVASSVKRKEYWEYKFRFMEELYQAKPNRAHTALVELEKRGKLRGIVTQNIDGMHRLAGNSPDRICEIHGNNLETVCLDCEDIRPWEAIHERLRRGEREFLCEGCGGLIKPNTISFGQALVPSVMDLAQKWARSCDLMLAVGSTLIVEPAASLPLTAKQNGAKLAIITLSETPLDRLADLKITAKAGEILSEVVR